MAITLNNKVGLKIASVDLSDHVTSVTLNQAFDELEVTAMGDTAHKFVKGLESATITVSFLNDQAATSVLDTLSDAYGTTVAWKLIQDKVAAVSATNKLWTGDLLVNNLTPCAPPCYTPRRTQGLLRPAHRGLGHIYSPCSGFSHWKDSSNCVADLMLK